MQKFILAIDQGTTGTTTLLIDSNTLRVIDKINIEFKQYFPKPSWVEHDLNEIWSTVSTGVKSLLLKNSINPKNIQTVGITNQRETTCAYDNNGKPLYHAIVWQDRRTQDFCNENKTKFTEFQKITGLPLDAYFSSTKMKWLLDNVVEVKSAAENNNLHLSTIDSFLLFKLSGNKSFLTEPTNASRTNLMNLKTLNWDENLLNFFNIKKSFLPQINETFSDFGKTKGLDFLPDGIPINCLIGDQQSALFGQNCFNKGELKCTYGTGAFLLLNTGNEINFSKNGLLTTVAYKYQNKGIYALEGSTYIAGASVQWLRDNLNFFESSKEVENLASNIKNLDEMEFIMFFPFFTGIGSPYWQSDAKAAIIGITRDTKKEHISRACLEGISLSISDLVNAFEADLGEKITEVKVDGGAVANKLLMQIQSNFLNKKIIRPQNIETTSFGAALGAAIGANIISFENIKNVWKIDLSFTPESNLTYYQKKINQWNNFIKKIFLN